MLLHELTADTCVHMHIFMCAQAHSTHVHMLTFTCTQVALRLSASLQVGRWLFQRTSTLGGPGARAQKAAPSCGVLVAGVGGRQGGPRLSRCLSWEAGWQLIGHLVAEAWSPAPGHSGLPTAQSRPVGGPLASLLQFTGGACRMGKQAAVSPTQ